MPDPDDSSGVEAGGLRNRSVAFSAAGQGASPVSELKRDRKVRLSQRRGRVGEVCVHVALRMCSFLVSFVENTWWMMYIFWLSFLFQ